MKSTRRRVPIAAVVLGVGIAALAAPTPAQAGSIAPDAAFTIISQPIASYKADTCRYSTDDVRDGSIVAKIGGCGGAVKFGAPLSAMSVPSTWATWGSPPATETAKPHGLWTDGATSITIKFPSTKEAGFELEPNQNAVESVTAKFMHGTTVLGIIHLKPSGGGGALLFAAKVKPLSITSVLITDKSGDDFAIANIRRER